jgi:spore maturation protein CgeB
MNLKRLFKELYLEKFDNQKSNNPDVFNIDWENIIFYTEQPHSNTINMVVYFKQLDRTNWNRANIVIDTEKFRIEEMEFFTGDTNSVLSAAV